MCFCHVTSQRRLRPFYSIRYFSVCSVREYQSILILLESCVSGFYDTRKGFWSILSFCSWVLMEWRPFIDLADYEERLCSGIELSDVLPCFCRFNVSVLQGCTHVFGYISFLGAGASELRKARVGFMSVRPSGCPDWTPKLWLEGFSWNFILNTSLQNLSTHFDVG